MIQGDRLRVVGERTAHLFLKGNGDRTVWWTRIDAESGTYRIDRRSEGQRKRPTSNAQVQQEWSNPLGMPEPIDPRKVGAVVLHGGGANQDLIDVFPRLTHQSLPRLLHCPAADTEFQPLEGETAQEFRSRAGEYFDVWIEKEVKGECQELKFLSCRTAEEAKRASFLEPIRKADGVWFSGGDQAELSRLFVDPEGVSPFEAALHEVVRRGGVVGGSSAGTAIMAKVMIVSTQENNTGPMRANIGKGLSLLRHAIIEQHLGGEGRAGRLERFTELLLNDAKVRSQMDEGSQADDKFGRDRSVPHRIGLAIEEETWIVIRGHQIEVFGKNRAHVFLVRPDRSQIAWHELVPGDRALLRSGPEGLELEFDEWSVARLIIESWQITLRFILATAGVFRQTDGEVVDRWSIEFLDPEVLDRRKSFESRAFAVGRFGSREVFDAHGNQVERFSALQGQSHFRREVLTLNGADRIVKQSVRGYVGWFGARGTDELPDGLFIQFAGIDLMPSIANVERS